MLDLILLILVSLMFLFGTALYAMINIEEKSRRVNQRILEKDLADIGNRFYAVMRYLEITIKDNVVVEDKKEDA